MCCRCRCPQNAATSAPTSNTSQVTSRSRSQGACNTAAKPTSPASKSATGPPTLTRPPPQTPSKHRRLYRTLDHRRSPRRASHPSTQDPTRPRTAGVIRRAARRHSSYGHLPPRTPHQARSGKVDRIRALTARQTQQPLSDRQRPQVSGLRPRDKESVTRSRHPPLTTRRRALRSGARVADNCRRRTLAVTLAVKHGGHRAKLQLSARSSGDRATDF